MITSKSRAKWLSKINGNMVVSYTANFFAILCSFWSMYLITNNTSVATYGVLTIIIATSGIITNVVSSRTSEAVVKFVNEEQLKQGSGNIKFIVLMGLLMDIFISLILLLIFYLSANFIATTIIKQQIYSDEVWSYSLITALTYMRGVSYGILQTKERFKLINGILTFESLIKIIGLAAIVHWLEAVQLQDIIHLYILIALIILCLFLFFFSTIYIKEYQQLTLTIDKGLAVKYWTFTVKTFTSSLLKAGNKNVDTLILGYFTDTRVVGTYEIIKKMISTPLVFLSSPFNLLYYSKLVNLYLNSHKVKFIQLIKKTTVNMTVISLMYLAVLIVCQDYIITLVNLQITTAEYNIYVVALFIFSIPVNWWSRMYSNIVNPMYSLYVNLTQTCSMLLVVTSLSYLKGVIGLLTGLVLIKAYTTAIWYFLIWQDKRLQPLQHTINSHP